MVEAGVRCRARGEIFPPPRKPAGARTVLPCASGTGIARRASMSTRARCFASVTLDRYGRRGGASATGERLGARFPRASETSSRAVPVLLRSRPRRTARCLTPRAVMDPTAYPDGRWSVGSHASPGTRRIAQGCVQNPFHSTFVASFIQVTAFRGAGPVSTTPALFIYRTAAAETSLLARPRVKLTARTVRYHRRKTFDDKLNAIGVILTVRRPGPHPTRPSSTKFTSPAPKRTRHEKQNFPLPLTFR